jgi:hypothetical protein
MKLPFVHAKHGYFAKDMPDAPPSPKDGQKYIDPKIGTLRWDATEKLWIDDSTFGGGTAPDREGEHE